MNSVADAKLDYSNWHIDDKGTYIIGKVDGRPTKEQQQTWTKSQLITNKLEKNIYMHSRTNILV